MSDNPSYTEFLELFFDFAKEKGFFISKSRRYAINSIRLSKDKPNDDYEVINKVTFNDIIKKNKNINFYFQDEESPLFFIEYFEIYFQQQTLNNKKYLFKNIDLYTSKQWSNFFERLLNNIDCNKEVIKFIHTIPISVFRINKIQLNQIDNYLINREIDNKDIENFFVRFIKNRKNQIQDSYIAPIVHEFLINKYGKDKEKLSPYFDFFNYIKSEFETIDFDFEKTSDYLTFTRLNLKKISNVLCIPKLSESTLKLILEIFVYGMAKHYNFSEVNIDYWDKSKKVLEIRIYSTDNFSKHDLEQNIKEFLNLTKESQNTQINQEFVQAFLMKKSLNNSLKTKDAIKKNNIKI